MWACLFRSGRASPLFGGVTGGGDPATAMEAGGAASSRSMEAGGAVADSLGWWVGFGFYCRSICWNNAGTTQEQRVMEVQSLQPSVYDTPTIGV